mmetsp:Transcript_39829/g.77429  ORF Transcript_39829/g.77429 Transcript_39829/m.77429 type:complete len:89 (+) Transcript_39829:1783-2049(+)
MLLSTLPSTPSEMNRNINHSKMQKKKKKKKNACFFFCFFGGSLVFVHFRAPFFFFFKKKKKRRKNNPAHIEKTVEKQWENSENTVKKQ